MSSSSRPRKRALHPYPPDFALCAHFAVFFSSFLECCLIFSRILPSISNRTLILIGDTHDTRPHLCIIPPKMRKIVDRLPRARAADG